MVRLCVSRTSKLFCNTIFTTFRRSLGVLLEFTEENLSRENKAPLILSQKEDFIEQMCDKII